MPKRARKRLTQPKGISVTGRRTRDVRRSGSGASGAAVRGADHGPSSSAESAPSSADCRPPKRRAASVPQRANLFGRATNFEISWTSKGSRKMPKKAPKRLTQRKGISVTGRSTRAVHRTKSGASGAAARGGDPGSSSAGPAPSSADCPPRKRRAASGHKRGGADLFGRDTNFEISQTSKDGDVHQVDAPLDGRLRVPRLHDSAAPPVGAHPQRARLTLPSCLRLADSPRVGVIAVEPLPRGLRMGPYEGHLVRTENVRVGGYSWRVRHGRLVDTGDEAHSNWMRFLNCAPDAARRNLTGFQYRGALYFRTVAPVALGEELLVYYADYAPHGDGKGNYVYHPPCENPEWELAATCDGGTDGAAGEDHMLIIDVDCHDGPSTEERELELEDGSSVDPHKKKPDYSPLEEDPKLELSDGEGDVVVVDCYYDYGFSKEEPEPKFTATNVNSVDEGADDDCACNVDGYCEYRPPKEVPEPDLATTNGGGGDGSYNDEGSIGGNANCDPSKQKPKPKLAVTGNNAVTEDSRGVDGNGSYCGVNLCTQEFKVDHELRCKDQRRQREFESQVPEVYHCVYCKGSFLSKEYKEQHQQKYCRKRPVAKRRDSNGSCFECDKCKYVTKWKENLDRHLLNQNKNNAEWFTCTQCPYKTVLEQSLTIHTKNHHVVTFSCSCPICGRSFRTKQCLDDHLLRQHSEKLRKFPN